MADTQLIVGGENFAVNPTEVQELETGLSVEQGGTGGADDPDKNKKPADGDGHEGDGHEGDGHDAPDDVEERTGRVDTELAGAANEQEREEIRARRREERRTKKERSRERTQTLERQVAQSHRRIEELSQQVALLSQHSQGLRMAQLDTAINQVDEAVSYFEGVISDATTKGDGEAVAKATSNLMAARDRARELKEFKEAAKNNSQPVQKALDPEVVNYAKEFMKKHRWYGGPRSQDLDSTVLSQIDNQVAREGFDPRGAEYWQELETRAARYLPHRFRAGGAGDDEGGDASSSREGGASGDGKDGYNGRANGDRRTPRSPVPGNSGDARSPKGGGEGFHLSTERVKAIKEAGKWDDPAARNKMIAAYKTYDREHSN